MKLYNIPVKTKFSIVERINESFTRCKCYVMAVGKNRNKSYISKETVEDALPTLANTPVVAFLYDGDDGKTHVGSHTNVLARQNGTTVWRSLCVPYGTVPDGTFSFEDVTESDGTTATYLVADVILWTGRFPEIMESAFDRDCWFHQSMEIKAEEYEKYAEDEKYMEIKKFYFNGLCLLGKSDDPDYDEEPCFPSASVIPYSLNEQFGTMMCQFKDALSECFSDKTNKTANGGVDKMGSELISSILAEFGFNPEQIDFEYAGMTEEDFRARLQEMKDADKPAEEFSTTYGCKRKRICSALEKHNIREEGHFVWFYLEDFDDSYAYVQRDEYKDGEEEKHGVGRFAYYVQDEEAVINGEFEPMVVRWLTVDENARVNAERIEFGAYKANHQTDDAEVAELKEFKRVHLEADHKAEIENVFSNFADLNGIESFETLKKDAMNYTDASVLEDKCFAIRGRMVKTPTGKQGVVNMPINNIDTHKVEPYGGLFSLYGNKD